MSLREKLYKSAYIVRRAGIGGVWGKLRARLTGKKFSFVDYFEEHYYPRLDKSQYEKELKDWYRYRTGRGAENIDHPTGFNDKIQWLKLHDDTELKQICADKYRVRGYLEEKGIEGLRLVPLLGVWDDAGKIDFSALPNSFVLKQNAGCKMNMIVKDKSSLDEKKARETLAGWLRHTFGWNGMELQYVASPKVILAEEYLEEMDGNLFDYKIFCFNGEPRYIQLIGDRQSGKGSGYEIFMDLDWNPVEFRTATYPLYDEPIPKPRRLPDMIRIARELSRPFPFVRVDLYDVNDEIYFGELTFTPTNGCAKWIPESADRMLGDMIRLPAKEGE